MGLVVVGLAVAALVRPPDSHAPDFEVALLDGGTFRLSDHLESDGRPLVLNLWASWCLPCRAEMPEIDTFAAAHPEVLVLGVAVDDTITEANRFAGEIGVSYPLAFDEGAMRRAYPSFGLPATFVIDTEGEIVEAVDGVVTVALLESIVP